MTALADTAKRADPAGRRFRISLTVTILSAFALVFVTVMGLTGVAAYREAMQAAVASADRQIADLTARTAARTAALVDPLYATVAVTAKLPDVSPGIGAAITPTEAAFRGLLDVLPRARAVSAASADGVLVQVLNLDAMTADRRMAMKLPEGARFAVREVAAAVAGEREETWRFLDAGGAVLLQRPMGPVADVRYEIWFRTGLNNDGIATTVLHMLPALGVPGLTIVRRMPEGGVLGIDVGLDSLGTFLAEQRISPRGSAFIIDDNGILLAHSDRAIAMSPGAAGQDPTWITIASSPDPIMHEVWINYATGRLAPGRGVELDIGGEFYLARVAALDHIGSPRALVAVVAPAADFTGPIERARDRTAIMFLVGGVTGLGLIALVASRITRPLAALTREADAIRRFDLHRPMTVASHITEVARLAATMQAMKAALHTFGVYVPKDLVRQLMGGDGTAHLGGERRVLTVMFTDIVGFTTIADGMDAETLMRLTSTYFEAMTRELMGAGGTIDKYVGDAVMALWNAPGLDEDHAARGCLAALRCRDLSHRLTREFEQRGWPALRTRFGVNTGEAVIGNVGSTDRMSYTAIGATVNMASRLEGLNKQYDTQILVTAATREAAGIDFVFRHVDRVLPKGRQTATDIHELLGLRSAVEDVDRGLLLSDADITRAARWDGIVAAYLDRRFVEARLLLPATIQPADRLGALYRQRLDAFIAEPPGSAWDGVAAYQEK